MKRRGSGVLLHITSLPSPYGIGDLGPEAYRFVDFLSEAKQGFWQILPLNPTNPAFGNSPYSSPSAFAGNPLLISPDLLVEEGLLSRSDTESGLSFPSDMVDYDAVSEYKYDLLRTAYENFKRRKGKDYGFEWFSNENSYWLDDYALFISLKEHFSGAAWSEWPEDIRRRNEDALVEWKKRLADRISMRRFFQYTFFKQFSSLKSYCRDRNIQIIGDIPIYVNYDSSDVWANPHIFKLDESGRPTFVAGVPPDYFSKTGQLWGNPVYRWDVLRETGYSWWIKRMEHNLRFFDIIRLDHFRGFFAYWEVPVGEKTAVNGRWMEAPAEDFFKALFRRFPFLPIIAEDLGVITPDVLEMMNRLGFPGMRLLIFAFGDDFPNSKYLPHNYVRNCVVYTGTHDNNTIKGWWRQEASPESKIRLSRYVGREVSEEEVNWEFIRLAMLSIANTVIIPMQDILGLGEEAKMNLPATTEGNWRWRLKPDQITPSLIERLREITETYGRG
ncbi:MAG TPA: 4-alpha-glucanotransferase [Thermodesulfobacteriota bacterium]|jgi:4-alpha-glucanotransferase|nr:4-alpha-glucanotransferase [Thermodesulfobacteriota bacterium]